MGLSFGTEGQRDVGQEHRHPRAPGLVRRPSPANLKRGALIGFNVGALTNTCNTILGGSFEGAYKGYYTGYYKDLV